MERRGFTDMAVVRKLQRAKPTVPDTQWASELTAQFWKRLAADPRSTKYWLRYADDVYRRSLRDEPMPGIWPKFTARSELAMAIYQALEEGTRTVPRGFVADLTGFDIGEVDCYSLAERILDDDTVNRIDAKAGQVSRSHSKRSAS